MQVINKTFISEKKNLTVLPHKIHEDTENSKKLDLPDHTNDNTTQIHHHLFQIHHYCKMLDRIDILKYEA